jgi:3-oxoacyl-[acyl-carrier protein] reductase
MINPLDMTGRRVVVTGASSGLGRATAHILAALGASIVLIGRDKPNLIATAQELPGNAHSTESLNLEDSDSIVPRLKAIAKEGGPLHGIVHSAGAMIMRPLRMVAAADCDKVFRLNVIAAIELAKGFRTPGVNVGGGSIVFMSSIAGLVGQPAQSLYCSTKGALIALSRSLAVELAADRIRVNCIAPAVVATGMSDKIKASVSPERWLQIEAQHPLGLGAPDDVAHAVAFLLADTGKWITGTTLVVDGGFTAQ